MIKVFQESLRLSQVYIACVVSIWSSNIRTFIFSNFNVMSNSPNLTNKTLYGTVEALKKIKSIEQAELCFTLEKYQISLFS